MASIILSTDFVGELLIANTAQQDVRDNLQYFIDKYETSFLKQLFGESFYIVFKNSLAADPVKQRFTDLIAIAEFKPAIASYIYFWYIRDQVTQTVGMGNVEPKSANAVNTSNGRKQTRAFNEMVGYVYQIIKYITSSGLFPEYVKPNWLYLNGEFAWQRYRNCDVPEIFTVINDNNI